MIQIEISPGELFDRYSILLIKKEKLFKPGKTSLENRLAIASDLDALKPTVNKLLHVSIGEYYLEDIKNVNETLWDLEEKVRWHESRKDFSEGFVEAARLIYVKNDERSRLKKKINEICGSELAEVKSYKDYS